MIVTGLCYLLSILSVALYIRYHWLRRRLYTLSWSLNGPIPLPFVGDALHFMCKDEELLDATRKLFDSYESPIKLWLGPKLVVVFTDMSHVEKLMSSMKFANKDAVYRFIKPFDGDSLISGSGIKWKTDRKLITPILSPKRVESYMPICTEQANILVNILKEKVNLADFDVERYFHRMSGEIVNEALLGANLNAQNGNKDHILEAISQAYILVHSRITKAWLHSGFVFELLGYGAKQRKLQNEIHGFMIEHLNIAKVKHNEETASNEQVRSIIDHLLSIKDDIVDFATDVEFVHHLTTLYTASEDTITIICSFALVMFGMHPEIQSKVAEELQNIFGPKPRTVRFDDLTKVKYLAMCIKEVMRLFPIAPFIMRKASEDFTIDKWTIPKGCSVLVSIYNIHRCPKLWEKPYEFYPEHFLSDAVSKRHPYAFVPFSAGPRGCIGKPFAYMAITTVLATVLQHYEIEATGTLQKMQLKADISVRCKDGYQIRLKQRT